MLQSLIIRIPSAIASRFKTSEFKNIILNDSKSDLLQFYIAPEDYNAANPITIETKQGYTAPYSSRREDLYRIEAVENDARSHLKYWVLQDLLESYDSNIPLYDISYVKRDCDPQVVIIEDYHYLDGRHEQERGVSLRLGILNPEVLKGLVCDRTTSISVGNRYIVSPHYPLISGSGLDANEWSKYKVISRYFDSLHVDDIWTAGKNYNTSDRISAIAPLGIEITKGYSRGLRLVFTQTKLLRVDILPTGGN